MTAEKYNLTIEQGTTFFKTFTFPTGYTMPVSCRMTARSSLASTASLFNFDSTSTDGNLDIDGQVISLTIPASATAAYTFDAGVYDLELVFASSVIRVLEGKVKLSKEVTR